MEMNVRNVCFITIIVICVLSLSYGIYYQVFEKNKDNVNDIPNVSDYQEVKFDELFDNQMHYQQYGNSASFTNKIEQSKDIVYTTYTLNEIYEGKYEIQVSVPFINVNHDNVINMDKEITSIFYNKVNNILAASKKEDAKKTVYTISYTAYLNENILSLVIKANLKEGDNPQRVIVKAYNYNLSTNQVANLPDILEIKGISINQAEKQIQERVEEAINYTESLSSLGYDTSYKRNLQDDMYKIHNSDNYFIGPNGNIYVIYAYGNANFTTECDVVNLT